MRGTVGVCARRLGVLALSVVAVCAFSGELVASVSEMPAPSEGIPKSMMYEGYITTDSGTPLPDGRYDFRFSLYDSPDGGEPVWTEEHLGVEVVSGVVQVSLGEGTVPVPLDLPFDVQYYLSVQVGNDPEMVPRLRLMTTAYAFRAAVADEVPEASITGDEIAPLSITDEHIAGVSWEKITDAPEVPDGKPGNDPSVPSAVWHTRGNTRTDSEKHYVGTADLMDLILATDGEVRLRIAGDGSSIDVLTDTLSAKYILSRVAEKEGALFLADPGHGIKRTGDDDVRVYTSGGDLLLEGGNVGIGTTDPTAELHIVSTKTGAATDMASYPVLLESGTQGMAIKLDTSRVNKSNNFISFWDNGGMRGRVEGQDVADVFTSWKYYYFTTLDAIEIITTTATLIGDISDARTCVGVGAVVCPPGWGPVAASTANLVVQAGRAIATQVVLFTELGVAYESASGDYAEWLERLDPDEVLEPGDIVGVFGGKVTRRTAGAQQVMVVSHAPIVLGNMPPAGEEHLYAKVAFMGQVPVKVSGAVRSGDYIIPSGLDDGLGVAVPQMLMTVEEYAKAVGRSWGEADGGLVNIAVGLNQGDVAQAVLMQEALYGDLKADLAESGDDVLALEAEVAELRASIGDLSTLYQEVQSLRAAVTGAVELSPVSGTRSEDAEASGGSW
jgi:hypothetical protein